MFSQRSHYKHLSQKWTARSRALREKLWEKHKSSLEWFVGNSKQLAVGSLGGLLLLAGPTTPSLPRPPLLISNEKVAAKDIDKTAFLVSDLSHALPDTVRQLTNDEEKTISDILSSAFGFPVTSELDRKRLNKSYGLIGAEQHLARYPGDNMYSHFDTQEEIDKFWSSGMAPGLGAWRYFAPSKEQMTKKDKLREKYYLAVQTFLVPDYNSRVAEYRDFFKFRKMLVVNPQNGKAMVVVIGDAGPAEWTGKHLGGSPEVMSYLEREDGVKRGPVLYFFIDDPNDTIPLGPIVPKQNAYG